MGRTPQGTLSNGTKRVRLPVVRSLSPDRNTLVIAQGLALHAGQMPLPHTRFLVVLQLRRFWTTITRHWAVSSAVRALASHARGHWFKSSTAHAEVAEWQTRYVQG